MLLNACLAGQSSDRTPFTTVGPQLLQTGIPAVVAMQYKIHDEDAVEFAQYLYEELLVGPCPGHIDAAVSYARSNLYVSHPDRFSFGTPVLWLNARDGQIFHLESMDQALPAANKIEAGSLTASNAGRRSDDEFSVRSSNQNNEFGNHPGELKKPIIEPAELASWLTDRRERSKHTANRTRGNYCASNGGEQPTSWLMRSANLKKTGPAAPIPTDMSRPIRCRWID